MERITFYSKFKNLFKQNVSILLTMLILTQQTISSVLADEILTKIPQTHLIPFMPDAALIPSNFVGGSKNFPNIKKYFPFSFTDRYLNNWDTVLSNFYDRHTEDQIKILDLDAICNRSITRHWDVKRKKVNIQQARLSVVSAIGKLLPHLNIAITLNQYLPINLVYLFKGLFSFVVPANWFNLFRSAHLLKAEQYGISDILIDRYTIAKTAYYDALETKWNFAIQSIFYHHIQNYLAMFQGNPNVDPNLLNLLFNLTGGLADRTLAIKQSFRGEILPELIFEINSVDESNRTIIDIQNIVPPDIERSSKLDQKKFWEVVIENSLKLKLIDQIKLANLANVGTVAASPLNIINDDPNNVGISLGLENLTDPIIVAMELKKIALNYDQMKNEIRKNLMATVNTYNVILDRYKIHQFFLEQRKNNLENVLQKTLRQGSIDISVYFAANDLMQSYLELNKDFFSLLKTTTALDRLLVTPVLRKVVKVVPFNVNSFP